MTAVFHPKTKARLDQLADHLPHALIFSGPHGIGLTAAAEYLAHHTQAILTTVLPEKNEKIDIEKGVISVDSIRRLYDSTKTISTKQRIIVVDYAERMGIQAQNAFLKLLEEPSAHTCFILLTHDMSSLLPTVQSRSQQLTIHPVSKEQSEALLDSLKVLDTTKRTQLLFIARGLPAMLTSLSTDEAVFTKRASIIRDARQLIQASSYDRLVLVQKYKDDRAGTLLLLQDAMTMLRQAPPSTAESSLRSLEAFLTAYERIAANGNIKLQLGALVV